MRSFLVIDVVGVVAPSGASTLSPMGDSTVRGNTAAVIVRAREGGPWYTWRGRLRRFYAAPGRLVLNAVVGDELVGSALASTKEADEDEQGETAWSFADGHFSASGPYFGDPDCFAEPFYLHLESLYVRRHMRRHGVAHALIEAVRALGLPTFCEFRPKWLEEVFERWRAGEENEESFTWTMEGEGGGLGITLGLAMDNALEGEDARLASGSFHFEAEFVAGGEEVVPVSTEPDDDSDGDDLEDHEEGRPEEDRALVQPYAWDEEDAEWLPRELEDATRFQLQRARSGIELRTLAIETLAPPVSGHSEPARFRVTFEGKVVDPVVLALRARWRHYLRHFERDWEPETVAEAITETVWSSRFRIEHIRS